MVLDFERELVPNAALRPWIAEVRVLRSLEGAPRVMTRLPNATSSIVVCSTRARDLKVLAVGPTTHALYKLVEAVPFYTRIAFRPGGARAFFDVALHELADRAVSVDELWGAPGACLRSEVERVDGDAEGTLRAFEATLLRRLDAARSDDAAKRGFLRRAVAMFDSSRTEDGAIHDVARRLRVSERYLRQVFREEIGVSPKKYARIARIRRVVDKAGSAGWAHLAAEHGFYDQAHLVAEFRELLGVTPRAFLAGDVPLAHAS